MVFFDGYFPDLCCCRSALDPRLCRFAVWREERKLRTLSSATDACLLSGHLLLVLIRA
jgi:hypothetical protein